MLPNQIPVIVITQTNSNPNYAGNEQPGMVNDTGNAMSTPANSSRWCIADLGQHWQNYTTVIIAMALVGPTTVIAAQNVYCGDSAAEVKAGKLRALATNTATAQASLSSHTPPTDVRTGVKPMGRFIGFGLTNSDTVNAVGAGSTVKFALYPN